MSMQLLKSIYKGHMFLSAEQEALLAEADEVMDASSNTFGMLNNADIKFPSIKDENGEEVEVTHGRYTRFLRKCRCSGYVMMHLKLSMKHMVNFSNTFASTLSGNVKKDNFYARVRKYDSARHAALVCQ